MDLLNAVLLLSLLLLCNNNIDLFIKNTFIRYSSLENKIIFLNKVFILFVCLNTLVIVGFHSIYLFQNIYFDHVEPHMASVSWLFNYEKDIYTDPYSAERYSLAYGPIAYLSNFVSLKILGPSIFSSKFISYISLVGVLIVTYFALKNISNHKFLSLFLIGYISMIFLSNISAPIGIRNDSLSYLIISISILICSRKKTIYCTLLFSVLFFFTNQYKTAFCILAYTTVDLLFTK